MNETLVKYLAGLLDADGNLSFSFAKSESGYYTLHLRMTLVASESIDKDGKFIKSLPEETKLGKIYLDTGERRGKWTPRNEWRVQKANEINMLLPRIVKHMVVKGKVWKWMYDTYCTWNGCSLTEHDKDVIRRELVDKRRNSGPLKPKNHPSWAWTAGFLDGDGCYSFRKDKKSGKIHRRLDVEIAFYDKAATELLYKAFGGTLRIKSGRGIDKSHWCINLGPSNKSFALSFLPKMAQHSKLKKHKIESLIHSHRQRLSESSPTG